MAKIISFFLISLTLVTVVIFYLHSENDEYVIDDEQNGLDKQIVLRFSHVVAENTPKGLAAQRFAKLVEAKTNNRVKVEIFPNGVLYSDVEEFEALKQGSIEMIAPASSKLSSYFPQLHLLDLPFAFTNNAAFDEAIDGDIVKLLLEKVDSENLFAFSLWRNGFKQMTSNKGPLIDPTDFYGQHFRIMPSQVIESQFQHFFVETSEIPFNLTYKNLSLGKVTGQENTLSNINSKKFYEVQDHLTMSNHGFLSYIVLMNKSFWDQLDTDTKAAIENAMEEATEYNITLSNEMNEHAYKNIKNSAIQIYELKPEEKKVWMEKFEPVYEEFAPVIGSELMEKLEKLREKYPLDY